MTIGAKKLLLLQKRSENEMKDENKHQYFSKQMSDVSDSGSVSCPKFSKLRSSLVHRRFSSEKCLTLTVASFFFRQTTEFIAYVPLFTETDKFTQAKFDQCKLTAKGPPFRFLPFLRNLQNRKTPKGHPFQFLSALCDFFSKIFNVSKESPFRIF